MNGNLPSSKGIIGISAFYHDSAAALLIEGEVVAAAQEERFTRIKHDAGFPTNAVLYCLQEAGLSLADIDHVVFYDKPFIKFERLLETYIACAPSGLKSFLAAMPVWLKEKLFLKKTLRRELSKLSGLSESELPSLLFTEHHQAHAASAFFASPFEEAAVLCIDGVGEWATTTTWIGKSNKLEPLSSIDFPHSLGLLYSAFTYYTGFKVNSGEYKLMGLAPYGEPVYVDLIREHLVDIKPDGSYRLNMDYFNYPAGLTMTNSRFDELFGGPRREPESPVTQKEMDLARSIQIVTEEVILRIARYVRKETGMQHLCLAGGVALNCVANGVLLREKIFDKIWIQPAAGDAGGAIGAVYCAWHEFLGKPRTVNGKTDKSRGSYLGPSYANAEITEFLDSTEAVYEQVEDDVLLPMLATLIAEENVVGWFQGRMEFGPRALGGRSIIGDARSTQMQSVMNLKIKYRESFRPFAPSVKAESAAQWFDLEVDSPYMLFVANVRAEKLIPVAEKDSKLFGIDKLNIQRSVIPAITHVDNSARVQTVHKETNLRYWHLLDLFEFQTDCPVLINTSFNVRGEPIVCTPEDAYRCFMHTSMDYLVMENVILEKSRQPDKDNNERWSMEFTSD